MTLLGDELVQLYFVKRKKKIINKLHKSFFFSLDRIGTMSLDISIVVSDDSKKLKPELPILNTEFPKT